MNREEYAAKVDGRRERLERRAEALEAEADRRFKTAHEMAEIMNGQPILIGHHSEKRHRRDLERMETNWRKGSEAHGEAQRARAAAAAVGSAGISSDDPDAVAKLTHKLETLERQREHHKALNAYWRKHKTMRGYAGMSDETADRMDAAIERAYSWEKQPVPKYQLSNLGAEIRRVKARIAELEREPAEVTYPEVEGVTVTEDTHENRLTIEFPGKPSEEVRKVLRASGFRWSPQRVAWVRMLNDAARHNARWVLQQIEGTA